MASASWPVRWCISVRRVLTRVRECRSQRRMPPSDPATASRSRTGERTVVWVAGGSPKVASSRKAAAPRARSSMVT